MAKIRAYKLAEELGLGHEELLKRAAEAGVQLRSHMVGIEDDEADMLRRRLGAATAAPTVERRLAGGAVIRRRRVTAPTRPDGEPEAAAAEAGLLLDGEAALAAGGEVAPADDPSGLTPQPFAVEPDRNEPASVEPAPAVLSPAAHADAAAASAHAPADIAPEPEDAADAPVDVPAPSVRPARAEPPVPSGRTGGRPNIIAPPALDVPTGTGPAPLGGRRQVARRAATQEMNLREQDTLARTMLGHVQRRLEERRVIVERQSRMAPARRVRAKERTPRKAIVTSKRPKIVKVAGELTLKEMSRQCGLKVRDLWHAARVAGVDIDRDAKLDAETIGLIGAAVGFEVQVVRSDIETMDEALREGASPQEGPVETRPPVVTVMGHVDHGKTSLLDYIRKANVVAGESGGITQHIGAYSARTGDSTITFIDTPGHAAFTNMRARGAQVTDIVVLVVAADDGVMPQTVEAINHARAASVPIIVAINKVDLPDANTMRIKQALLEHKIVAEEFGGDTIVVEVSAKKGTGIDRLLEMLSLQAEILELRAHAKGPARGWVVEAQLDKGRGPVATVLIREGSLEQGQPVVIGTVHGRVRTLCDDQGHRLKQAGPSIPVQIIGLSGVPQAGDELAVVASEREAKALVEHRLALEKRAASEGAAAPPMGDIFASLGESETKELCLVVKADVHGTLEAVREGVAQLATQRVSVKVIHTGVGAITDSDIMLASASNAAVVGFRVRPESTARHLAERESVEIRSFDVVYELFDEVKALMQGLLPPRLVDTVSGTAEVRELFRVPRVGVIAGCQVREGTVRRGNSIRVVRNGVAVYTGRVSSLRRFKDDVREVNAPLECGIGVDGYNDVKVGDTLESFVIEEHPDAL
jgi:translation initiation factor IF-2